MKKALHSYRTEDGTATVIACSECTRGGNGKDKDKCSCGWQVKRWNKLGCMLGVLLPTLELLPKPPKEK